MVKASIIIPTLNEENYILNILKDLKKQKNVQIEIIVIDANSKDKTINKIKSHDKKIKIIKTNPNIAHQRNLGGFKAKNDYLFFIDADTRISDNFILNCILKLNQKNLDIACPKYIPITKSYLIKFFYTFFNYLFAFSQNRYASGAGSCIIIKKNVFNKNKGFNEKIIYDDIELIRRFSKKYKFGIINEKIYVSDRRFIKYGFTKTVISYIKLSYYFSKNQFKIRKKVDYKFGEY